MEATISAFLFRVGLLLPNARLFFRDSCYCHPGTCRIRKGKFFIPSLSFFEDFPLVSMKRIRNPRREGRSDCSHLLTVPIGTV